MIGGGEALVAHLVETIDRTRRRVREDLSAGGIRDASDDNLLRVLFLAAEMQRLTDAVLVEAVERSSAVRRHATGICA